MPLRAPMHVVHRSMPCADRHARRPPPCRRRQTRQAILAEGRRTGSQTSLLLNEFVHARSQTLPPVLQKVTVTFDGPQRPICRDALAGERRLSLLRDYVGQIGDGVLIADAAIRLASDESHICDLVDLARLVALRLEQRLRDDVMPLNEMQAPLMGKRKAQTAVPILSSRRLQGEIRQ